MQRFITIDPVQDLTDPLQWNPYIYSNNTPITQSDPTGLKACTDYFSCGYQIPTKKKKSTPKPCSTYFSCGYSMPKHAQLHKYPTKRIQREMKELGRKQRAEKRESDAEKARQSGFFEGLNGTIKGAPSVAGPPTFNATWSTPTKPQSPGTVQHLGIFEILELLINGIPQLSGTSGVGDGTEGVLNGIEKTNPRNSGKVAGRLAGVIGTLGIFSDIQEYNDQNNARGHYGWDANWRTGYNVAASYAFT